MPFCSCPTASSVRVAAKTYHTNSRQQDLEPQSGFGPIHQSSVCACPDPGMPLHPAVQINILSLHPTVLTCCVIDCSAVRVLALLVYHADIDADCSCYSRVFAARQHGHSAYSRGTLDSCYWCTGKLYQVSCGLVAYWPSYSPDAACVDLGFLGGLQAPLGKRDA